MSTEFLTTEKAYDAASHNWARNEKLLLSDFTARPYVLEKLQPLAGKTVLDLGCGEGFVARQVKDMGASTVLGIDLSQGMIEQAKQEERRSPKGIDYLQADVIDLTELSGATFDRIVAVFLFNYLDLYIDALHGHVVKPRVHE